MPYAELLARTNFSLLEGASHPEEMVEAAARAGVSHLGVVDRDGVYGLVRAHKAAGESGVSLVCGATLTVVGRPPVVLLAESSVGWAHLCRLLTEAQANAEKGRAEVGVDRVVAHAEGLFCVLRHGWTPERAATLREAFDGRLAVALVRRMEPGDRARARSADALAAALDIPILASNAPIFHAPERQRLADVLTCVRRRTTLEEAGYALSANAERVLLAEEAFHRRFADRPDAVRAALEVAERCRFSLEALKYQYPHEVVPEGWTPMGWLTELVRRGLCWRYPEGTPDKVQAMVAHELRVIEELDFPAYFLTVYDIVRFARGREILCQGRGSAANSAVCYALGITSVDPARATLLFERFISKERGEPPDIDVDFEHERREEVIQYIYERYGRDRAALVNEVISYRRRSAIRDVGKVFGLSLDQVDRLAKATDRWAAGDLAQEEELIREAGLDPSERAVQLTMETADSLSGFPRHLSQHVGGFTITETPLIELVPVEKAAMENRTVIQWDKDDIDILQFVKVDVLALGMLTCIRKCFDLVEGFSGARWSLATIPPEDLAVYDMFCRADTVGVFQIESRAQMSMLPRLKPRCFYDLVIEVAIVRPGPIQGGMVHPYLRRRNGDEPVTYAHAALRPILERTLGVPLFQEQVMAMAVAVGGFTPGQADRLRRAMGAWRKRGRLDVLARRLVKGMIERGIAPDYAEAIFKQILGFGEYGFPESHAASFALLVYVSGWLKRHHPAAFAAGLINSQPMGFYSPRAIVADARRHGVEARPVCVQQSCWDCTLERRSDGEAALRLGLRLVQGFGEEDARRVEQARAEAPFSDLADFTRRTGLDRGKLQSLADAGAFRSFGLDRRRAVWELQGLWTLPLFAGLRRREPEPVLPEETPMDGLRADYRATGLSVAHHPVEFFRESLAKRGAREIRALADLPTGRRVSIGGLVSNRQRPGTANGVVFMTLEDETGMANLVVWPRTWAAQRKIARNTSLLGVDGRLQRQGNAISVLVERFWPIEEEPTLHVRSRDFH